MNNTDVTALFTQLAAANPAPRSELQFGSPFQLLVAVVLSAQATDIGVNKVTDTLFQDAPTPQAMAALGEAGIRERIRTLGLFNNKAKHLFALSRILLERHGGDVPGERKALETLPGVGRKTANVVLNVAFGQPTLAVDTHVFRVAHRTGLANPGHKTPLQVEERLLSLIPKHFLQHAHHWLILHGRHVCKARAPQCGTCTIARWCHFPEKSTQAGS